MSAVTSNSPESWIDCRNVRLDESTPAIFAVPDKRRRRLPRTLESDLRFAPACAKSTSANGKAFPGAKSKRATPSWQRVGQSNIPLLQLPVGNHCNNLSAACARKVDSRSQQQKNVPSLSFHTLVLCALC